MEPDAKYVEVGGLKENWYANINYYDMRGSDYRTYKLSNTECLQKCNQKNKCVGVVFDYKRRNGGTTCYLKKRSPFYEGHLSKAKLTWDKDIEFYSRNK